MTIKMTLAVTTLSILMPLGLICTQAAGAPNLTTVEDLQGSWEGTMVGQAAAAGKISITIKGNSLHYQGLSDDEWYETTFTLPVGTYPQQLHATIKDCAHPCDSIGKAVFAIVRVEGGILTLVGIQATATEPPKIFDEIPGFEDNSAFRYKLRKVQQPSVLPPKSK